MSLSCYVHIPYCIQKCLYCDFTTFTCDKLPPPEIYVSWIRKEINQRHQGITDRNLRSIYFGGGTPSLIPAKEIISIINHLKKYFSFHPNIEISLEINPGTLTRKSLDMYLSGGVNRFSVGVQTFRDDLLKLFNREHSSKQTKDTLSLLIKSPAVLSADLLFALNHQTTKDLQKDMNILLSYNLHHISAYYLTLPTRHPLQNNRPPEPIQLKMFRQIELFFKKAGFDHYEISNFARKGFYCRHNLSYWLNKNYWGLGLSSHSFLKTTNQKVRFWNPRSLKLYAEQVEQKSEPFPFSSLPKQQKEFLTLPEALTDFCHTALRTCWGIQEKKLKAEFGEETSKLVLKKLKTVQEKKWVEKNGHRWVLTPSAQVISNQVFNEMTFLKEDYPSWNFPTPAI